jgi:hypothetical protein
MGMLDSFYVDIDNETFELQTKKFANVLQHYQLGQPVDGASGGVCVFFDEVYLNSEGKRIYNKDEAENTYTIFIVLVHSVFTHYESIGQSLEECELLQKLTGLREAWLDTAKVMSIWLTFLRNAHEKERLLSHRIRHAESIVDYARRLQAGEDLSSEKRWHFALQDDISRLEKGDNLLDIFADALQSDSAGLFAGRASMADELASYRL